jgi:hypothetical protein
MKTSSGMKSLALALCTVAVMALTVGVAQATTYTWTFTEIADRGVVSSPHTYLDTGTGTIGLTASGWNTTNIAPTVGDWTLAGVTGNDLYGKFTSGDASETGLGLAGKPSFEIQPSTLIQLDLLALQNAGLTDLTMQIGSVQAGESWAIFSGNEAAANDAIGTLVGSGTGGPVIQDFALTGSITNRYAWITSTNIDVLLLDGVSATSSVPNLDPAPVRFRPCGLAGIRRKFKK